MADILTRRAWPCGRLAVSVRRGTCTYGLLGDRHTFTVISPTGASRTYSRYSAAAYEEGLSRIYCGIRFRTTMNRRFLQGTLVEHYVDKHLMRPLED